MTCIATLFTVMLDREWKHGAVVEVAGGESGG
jgi:hypothetical protein